MTKVKRVRTIDCVVLGYRPGTAAGTIGSLILGLYEARRGGCDRSATARGSSAKEKRELPSMLAQL